MRKAVFNAKIKKIEINNRVLSDGYTQTIRVILDDITLNDENLTAVKNFQPNELVSVEIIPLQLSFTEDHVSNEEPVISKKRFKSIL